MASFSHAYGVAFTVRSHDPEGADVTPSMLKAALLARVADLDAAGEWHEAVGTPVDTYQEDAA
ncbi:hypothetical protein [Sphingomonas lacusdianchii]|uniref:hypothetical protein n=1 Tax=Sphingomonas lacusdianchii TaxID=2917992 RepID=UPI001F577BC9|nr:hypothetical protein [Sphingomonas sp. JXJ CY 53]